MLPSFAHILKLTSGVQSASRATFAIIFALKSRLECFGALLQSVAFHSPTPIGWVVHSEAKPTRTTKFKALNRIGTTTNAYCCSYW